MFNKYTHIELVFVAGHYRVNAYNAWGIRGSIKGSGTLERARKQAETAATSNNLNQYIERIGNGARRIVTIEKAA